MEIHATNSGFLVWKDVKDELIKLRIYTDFSTIPLLLSIEQVAILLLLNVAVVVKDTYSSPSNSQIKEYKDTRQNQKFEFEKQKESYITQMKRFYLKESQTKPLKPMLNHDLTSDIFPWYKSIDIRIDPPETPKFRVFRDLYFKEYHLVDGSKFGGDFLVYLKNVEECHSSFIVNVIENDTLEMCALIALSRMALQVNKKRVFAKSTPSRVEYLSFEWTSWV